jgi:glycosyltransferase involved in cell wall biosynthesis
MKIAHVLTFLDSKRSYGGPVSVALGIAEEQKLQGHQITLVALSDELDLSFLPSGLSAEIFQVRKRKYQKKFSSLINLGALYWVLVNRNKFDIIHLHFSRDLFQVIVGLIATRGKAKVILQPHGMITNEVAKKKIYQKIYDGIFTNRVVAAATGVVALQKIEERALVKNFNCLNVSIIPNGIRFGNGSLEIRKGKSLVIFLTRLHPQKNPQLFVDVAIEMIKNGSDIQFAIGGTDGGLQTEIESTIHDANLSQLKFLGALNNSQVLDLFGNADLLVLPSQDDQYPMVILEALSCGLEVVLSSSSGLAHAIEKHDLGYVCEPDLQSIEQAISQAIANPRNPIKIRETARSIFNIASVVNSLDTVYREYQVSNLATK